MTGIWCSFREVRTPFSVRNVSVWESVRFLCHICPLAWPNRASALEMDGVCEQASHCAQLCGPQAPVLTSATSGHKLPQLRMRRPSATPQELSPQCAWARAASSSGAPRFLSEKILALERDSPGRHMQHWSDLWSQVSLLLLCLSPNLYAHPQCRCSTVYTYAIYMNMVRGPEVDRRALRCAQRCPAPGRARRRGRFPRSPQATRHAGELCIRTQAAQVSAGPVAVWLHTVAHGLPLMQRISVGAWMQQG